jgi:restriction endonuclease S subunit
MKNELGTLILHIESGSQFFRSKGDGKVPVLTAANIDRNGQFVPGVFKRADEKAALAAKTRKLEENDLVMVRDSSDCDRCLVLDKSIIRKFKFISEHLFLIKPSLSIQPEYLWLKLNHPTVRAKLRLRTNGSSTPFFTQAELKAIPLDVPDIKTQKIVIQANRLLLEVHRLDYQAAKILRSIEIKLFEEHFGNPEQKRPSDNYTNLIELCTFIKDGSREGVKEEDSGVAILSSRDFSPFAFKLESASKVSDRLFMTFADRVLPQNDDVVIALSGKNRGYTALVNSSERFSVRNVAVIRTPKESLLSAYLTHYLNHPFTQYQLREIYSRGSGVKYISVSKLKLVEIPIPEKKTLESWRIHSDILAGWRKCLMDSDQKTRSISESFI